ncbi:hypothetical protein B0H11DRAFT_2327340 [Mycena galericulata]|nr:hypothetical protein B0H11DRAFT_2327340 [Mycena galericulata]
MIAGCRVPAAARASPATPLPSLYSPLPRALSMDDAVRLNNLRESYHKFNDDVLSALRVMVGDPPRLNARGSGIPDLQANSSPGQWSKRYSHFDLRIGSSRATFGKSPRPKATNHATDKKYPYLLNHVPGDNSACRSGSKKSFLPYPWLNAVRDRGLALASAAEQHRLVFPPAEYGILQTSISDMVTTL